MGLLSFWFGFGSPVCRRAYVLHGLLLAAVKLLGDAALFRLCVGVWDLPAHALDLTTLLMDPAPGSGPGWLGPLVLVWNAPFLWIGLAMSTRRATDAGLPGWIGLWFLLPLVHWLLIGLLAWLPTVVVDPGVAPRPPLPKGGVLNVVLVMGLALVLGLLMTVFSVEVAAAYGSALFLGAPFVVGAVVGFGLNLGQERSLSDTLAAVGIVCLLLLCAALVLALEGALCLVMAVPILAYPALMGACFGRGIACLRAFRRSSAVVVLLLFPALLLIERGRAGPAEHEVRSTVDIAAPPSVVWRNVVAFGELPEPPPLLFRLGIAYPQRARIDGHGVGAERRCEFSTGPFVEPITVWDAPIRLAFDVQSQPPTMTELSPHAGLAPRHLDGFFQATRGEFRLDPLPGGGTRLHGCTWYRMDIHPQGYWHIVADQLVHWIHLRVMEHVRDLAEK